MFILVYAFRLYTLLPNKNKYYVGSCEDINKRLIKHNTNHAGFTGKTGDWIVKWADEYPTKADALKRESK